MSARADIITRRTYSRPLNEEGTVFETWEQTVDRVIGHQKWLWERAQNRFLSKEQIEELEELRELMLAKKVFPSGRTLWLGGTEIAKRREASQFNCSFTNVETVYDLVDVLWLLLNGCGVGVKPITGTLSGFRQPIETLQVIRSKRTTRSEVENNVETWDSETKHWTIKIGDSAEAWAKSIGKLCAGKYPAKTLTLDFSEIRPAGLRLKGYGWISSGDTAIYRAYSKIFNILNSKADSLLTKIDIMDIVNLLGTILSSRRSAEIVLYDYDSPGWKEFALAKKDMYELGRSHREQSNNSLLFYKKPTREQLREIFDIMEDGGGSEPGLLNMESALRRAPWATGFNPCGEVILSNKSFCNLTEIDIGKFLNDNIGLRRAVELAARLSYRQTCVNLKDGILQEAWHLNNQFLRLCGVGLTGIVKRSDLIEYDYISLKRFATSAAYAMANELDSPKPKNTTLVKPSGTFGKVMDTTEGIHKPLGKYIFNNVQFGKHDPLVRILTEAGYNVFSHPTDFSSVLITLPVEYQNVEFDKHINQNGDVLEVNNETAIEQLNRYKMIQNSWSDQNTSCTIYYQPGEKNLIIDWLLNNWDSYVGVSFLYKTDPSKTPEDLGYLYLPQQVVTKETYNEYVKKLKPINLDLGNSFDELKDNECATGACPIR